MVPACHNRGVALHLPKRPYSFRSATTHWSVVLSATDILSPGAEENSSPKNGGSVSGPFEVHVARTFPLDQAADARRELNKHYPGKQGLPPQ
jgi:hypothetical protein